MTTLSAKLDEMDTAISSKANATDLHTHDNKTVLDGITAAKVAAWDSGTGGSGTAGENGATFTPSVSAEGVISWTNDKGLTNPTPVNIKGADGLDGLDGEDGTTVVVGTTTTGAAGTNASVTGVLNEDTNTLTLNFTIPRGADGESGTSASITANEVLEKLKTVDGQNSGIDADMLDGHDTDYFATATQLDGKANADHTHTEYASTSHTHAQEDITGLTTALNGKANTSHTHTEYASTSDVEALQTSVNGKADINHTHTGYATTEQFSALETTVNGKADANHTHTQYAASDHTHTGYATTADVEGKANASHTHTQSDITGLETALAGKASTDHTHTEYATTSALSSLENTVSGKADANHTHSGYAATNHTHSGYASTSHTHSEYASTSHNHSTLSGTVNITGAIKSNGVQVGYNSGSDTTLGSNNYPTNVAGTYVTLNGEKTYAPNIYPRNTGTFYLGAQSNRWSGIYSKVAVNVSSDERLKENITSFTDEDIEDMFDFVNLIDVKTFNYIGDKIENGNIGVIAQQLIEANPDIATYFVEQGEDGYYGVKTSDLVFPLIVAVQELTRTVEKLEEEIEKLKK